MKFLCVQDKESLQRRRGLLPITLFSPHAVPSTAASSLEWHVFPTVHHSVWQTLCRKHGYTGLSYWTGQPIGTNWTCRERIAPCKPSHPQIAPWSRTSPCNIRGNLAYIHVVAEGGIGTVLQPALVAHVVEDTRGHQGVVQHLLGRGVIQAQPPAPAEKQRSERHHHLPSTL